MNVKTSNRDYFWSIIAYLLKFGVNLFLLPMVLSKLTGIEYGLWVTFTSVGAFANLFDFGFSSTLIRNLTYVWGGAKSLQKEGYEVVEKNDTFDERMFVLTMKTCQRIYLVVALLALVALGTVGSIYIIYVIRDILEWKYIIAWVIYAVSIFLGLYYSYWVIALKAVGAIERSQKATIIGFVLQLIIAYAGLVYGGGIISLSLAYCVSGIVIRMLSKYFLFSYQKIGEIFKKKYNITSKDYKNTFKTLWFNAKKAGVSSIASVGMSQSTTLICSAFYGVGVTGELGICFQLIQFVAGVAQIFFQTSIPKLTNLRILNKKEETRNVFSMSVLWAWVTYIGGMMGVIVFGPILLRLIGSQTVLNTFIFFLVAMISLGEANYSIHASYISLGNELPFVSSIILTSIVTIFAGLLCAVLKVDIAVLLLVRLVISSAYIFWKWPYVAGKQLGLTPIGTIKCGTQQWILQIKKIVKKIVHIA